jgi:allantoin racemase
MGFEANICYLLPGVGMSPEEQKRREGILNQIASSETKVQVRQVSEGPQSIENAVDEYQALPQVLKFVKAHQDNYDGIILGCAGDAGMEGAREQSRIPIAGPGESSILLGTVGDKRFSMITVSLERAAVKRRLVREAGLDVNRLISSHSTGIPVKEMALDHKRTQKALIKAMQDAKELGADVMLLGCMTVAFMEPRLVKEAQQEVGLSVVNPIVTAVKMAEALVAMQKYYENT